MWPMRAAIVMGLALVWAAAAMGQTTGHRLLVADDSVKRIAIIGADGRTEWEHKVNQIHDLHMLANGHVLFEDSYTHLVEIDPATNAVVWEYEATKMNGNEGKPVQVHAFERLADGNTMIAESGPGRIIEVDHDGRIVHEIKLTVDHPNPHRDTRLVRKLADGHYLVCHEGDGKVREYDGDGKVVWEYDVPLFGMQPKGGHGPEGFGNQVFAALRLPNGNTLMSTGNGHRILEVSPDKQIVWSLTSEDLPGIELAWVTTLQLMPNGNIVFGNCHAGPTNPQIIEVTRDKKVVWTFKDFQRFGNSTPNSQVLDVPSPAAR
ncbi:MAG: PQQ-binding-like beta-propeller repeat protein [Planctomycetes bacterium]|nr:PQQ-binding-like beta-propeller repeat protein [Planctomycetota bacterium]